MRRFEKVLIGYIVFFVALGTALIASRPHLGQLLKDIRLGNVLAKCEPFTMRGTVIGERCIPRFFSNGVNERHYILPEYQVAFFEMKTEEYQEAQSSELYPGGEWLFKKHHPIQRIPGTDQVYEYIPPNLDPKLQTYTPIPKKRAL